MAKDAARPLAGQGSDASLKRYLEDIRKAPQLRAEDETGLFRLFRKGSAAARFPMRWTAAARFSGTRTRCRCSASA